VGGRGKQVLPVLDFHTRREAKDKFAVLAIDGRGRDQAFIRAEFGVEKMR